MISASSQVQALLHITALRRQFRGVIGFGRALNIPRDHLRGTLAGLIAIECHMSRSQARIAACAIIV